METYLHLLFENTIEDINVDSVKSNSNIMEQEQKCMENLEKKKITC